MSIQLTNISKRFEQTTVFTNISIEIQPGEFFVMIGPSGSGKSTLLRIIAGLTSVSSGRIIFDGRDVTDLAPKARQLAMVFQNYALLPFMTVAQNVRFGLENLSLSEAEKNSRVAWALDLVHLSDLSDRKPKQLSGGQQQRVSLARALATQAPVVLMDEPLSNLDAQLRAEMREEILRLHREIGMTLIYVTHDQVEAMTMGDRILVLDDQKIQQLGTPLELYNQPDNEFVAKFIGSPEMNLLTLTVNENGDRFTFGETFLTDESFNLPYDLPAGHYHVGFRPEKLVPSTDASGDTLEVKVTSLQQLGSDTLIYSDHNGQTLVTRVPQQLRFDVGDVIRLALPQAPQDWHFFASDTGQRVQAPMPLEVMTHGVE